MTNNNLSPERIYITNIDQCNDISSQKHISRYMFASMFIEGGVVLDCACGSGYGTKILSTKANKVYGIDVANDAIEFAQKYNYNQNIEYGCQSLQTVGFNENSLQNIVSLETIEHISKFDMINYLKRSASWLSKDGCFIGSSPMLRYQNNLPYITNPYHINELPRNELLDVINECFNGFNIHLYHQNIKSFIPLHNENTGFCVFVARKLK